jgi:hypothetical protein
MQSFLILIIISLISCNNPLKETANIQPDSNSQADFTIDSILADTPKILKAGKDYVTIATSPYDKIYFGERFSPYKIEPYHIADLEQVIDSLIKKENLTGNFRNKSLIDYKYQIFSAKTAEKKLQARVQAICIAEADKKKWNSSSILVDDVGECYFSLIYDLTDKKVIAFQINSNE